MEIFDFDPAKDRLLREAHGIGFEDIIALIESDKLISVTDHPNREKYPNQILYEVDVEGYIYIVPAIDDGEKVFLKTVFPSRKATKKRRST